VAGLAGVGEGLYELSLVSVMCMAAACMYSMCSCVFVLHMVLRTNKLRVSGGQQPSRRRIGQGCGWRGRMESLLSLGIGSGSRQLCGLCVVTPNALHVCMWQGAQAQHDARLALSILVDGGCEKTNNATGLLFTPTAY
jgi:hypothetical protein